jgi:hypothetical protein
MTREAGGGVGTCGRKLEWVLTRHEGGEKQMLGARSSAAEAVILRLQQTAALLCLTCPS